MAKELKQKDLARFLGDVSDLIEEQDLRIEEQSEVIDQLSQERVEA